jgi:uncharacterized membrane protein
VGVTVDDLFNSQAFRRTAGGMEFLGLGIAYGVYADGSVVAGRQGSQIFRWTEAAGMEPLGSGSGEVAISADGSTIVGRRNNLVFRWTEAEGFVSLGDLPGHVNASGAHGVSADGSVIVGEGNPEGGALQPSSGRRKRA